MMRRLLLVALMWTAAAALRCSYLATAGNGGSSETVNAKVIVTDSTVSVILLDDIDESLSVAIYSTAYHPYEGYGLADSVTGSGTPWTAPGAGTFNVLATLTESGRTAFAAACTLSAGVRDTMACALSQPVTIEGRVQEDETAVAADSYAVSIIGTPFYAMTDAARTFAIKALPAGRYLLSLRPAAGRFFLSSTTYTINTDSPGTKVDVTLIVPLP
jgi:hypothetical protein